MILALVKACQDQINRSQLIGLGNSTVLGEFLACPARFERASLALEGLKNLDKQCLTMVYSALVLGVSFDSRELGLDGVWCGDLGVRRRLSGKPTVSAIRLI